MRRGRRRCLFHDGPSATQMLLEEQFCREATPSLRTVFRQAKDLVCAGCGKHSHARHACSSVTIRSIATAGAPAPGAARVPCHYPEDVSSDDNFFANLEVHPKVMPLLKVRIHHAKGVVVVISPDVKEGLLLGYPVTITPTKILTDRKVPLHWEEPARQVIDKALANGIFTKVEGLTDWISLAFFVDKNVPGEICLHLVMDFTGLNKYVLWPVHPFPSLQEIISSLNPRSWVFCKMDAVQGYHQIPLDEDSSLFTTFILPWGHFQYRCTRMGLSTSSDEWCRRSDKAIEGIPGVRKLVNDFLMEGETIDELRQRVHHVLDNCQWFRITISKRKLEVATQV